MEIEVFQKIKKLLKNLDNFTIKYLHSNKVAGVIKHIPGHGAAKSDSHIKMPKVLFKFKKLNEIRFLSI